MTENPSTPAGLRIGHVRGVVLHKWQRTWEERYRNPLKIQEFADEAQLDGLRDGSLDMCFVRLPIDRDGLHAIPLYEEQMVAWVAKDHLFAAADELTMGELADEETVLTELDATVTDAEPSPVALAWRIDDENPLLDEFVGVVRGRSANSSRTQKERSTSGAKPVKARPQAKKPSRPRKVRRGH